MSVFLGFEGLETGVGVLEGCMHLLWREFVGLHLCEYEIFCHFEQGLGHATFLGVGGWQEQSLCALITILMDKTRKIRPFSLGTSYPTPLT
jgi:hypothetical protein